MALHKALGKLALAASAGLATVLVSVQSQACADTDNLTDNVIIANVGCSTSFIGWAHGHFDLREFNGWGSEEPCNARKPYAKMIASGWMLAYALTTEGVRPSSSGFLADMQFHGGIDYLSLSHRDGNGGLYHDRLYYKAGNLDGAVAKATPEIWLFQDRKIIMGCGSFDGKSAIDDAYSGFGFCPDPTKPGCRSNYGRDDGSVVGRTATVLHEAMHTNHMKYGYYQKGACTSAYCCGSCAGDHFPGGTPGCEGSSCDDFAFHGPHMYQYNELWNNELNPVLHYHSAYQTEVEYGCDIALYSQNIPYLMRLQAGEHAEAISTRNILRKSIPPYRCDNSGFFSPHKR